jgi:quinolinate synthase
VEDVLEGGRGTVGSTSDLIAYAENSGSSKFIIGSECDLGATLKASMPEKSFYSPCVICPHMKTINTENTLAALEAIGSEAANDFRTEVPPEVARRARVPLERMMGF